MELSLLLPVFLFLGVHLLHTTEAAKSCVSCSTMDNIVAVKAVKDILNTYNHQFCRTHVTAYNKSGIRMDMCESTSKIYETKSCGILEGFVNGTAFNHPMSMNLFLRGCLAVQSDLVYDCQNTDSNQVDLVQNLAKVFQPLKNYVIKSFKGQRCLCKSNSCETSSSWSLSFHSRLWIAATFLSFLSTTG